VLYDNMRTVVVERHGYGHGTAFIPAFSTSPATAGSGPGCARRDLSADQGQGGAVHPVSAAELLYSAGAPASPGRSDRRSRDGEPGGQALAARGVANARIHGTTGEIPAERLVRERPHLQPIPLPYGGRTVRLVQTRSTGCCTIRR
jgi:hypothetical protein